MVFNKRKLLLEVSSQNKNKGFINQVKSDDRLLVIYCIRKKIFKIDKGLFDVDLVSGLENWSSRTREYYMNCLLNCNKYLSPKLCFVLWRNNLIKLTNKRLRTHEKPLRSSS